jgi:ribonuclease P protein component
VKKINRVKANQDFGRIVKTGKTRKNESFTIHEKANELNKIRVGISVSSRLGGAVVRNRIKRQVRAICDELIDYNLASIDIVIIIKNQFLSNDFGRNKDLLKSLLTYGGITNGK